MSKILDPYRDSSIEDDQFKTQNDRTHFVNDVFKRCSQYKIEVSPVNSKLMAKLVVELLPNEREVYNFRY